MVCAIAKHWDWDLGNKLSLRNAAIVNSNPSAATDTVAGDIRRIVVPLDGSRSAEHALPYAIAIARRSGASIRLVHVFSLLESFGPWEQTYHHDVIDRYRRQKYGYMNSIVARVNAHLDSYATSFVIDDVDVAGALGKMTDANTLVVMATRSRNFVKKLFHGSVADALIRKLAGPLLLVRGSSSLPDLASDPLPRHILIPLDGTACAEGAIAPAVALGAISGAQLSLVHLRDAGRMVSQREITAANNYLKDVAHRTHVESPRIDAEAVISERDIATDLMRLAEKERADWIALTAHTRPVWMRLFHRSVAKSIVRRAKMPLLIVRHALERDEQCEQVLVEAIWS